MDIEIKKESYGLKLTPLSGAAVLSSRQLTDGFIYDGSKNIWNRWCNEIYDLLLDGELEELNQKGVITVEYDDRFLPHTTLQAGFDQSEPISDIGGYILAEHNVISGTYQPLSVSRTRYDTLEVLDDIDPQAKRALLALAAVSDNDSAQVRSDATHSNLVLARTTELAALATREHDDKWQRHQVPLDLRLFSKDGDPLLLVHELEHKVLQQEVIDRGQGADLQLAERTIARSQQQRLQDPVSPEM